VLLTNELRAMSNIRQIENRGGKRPGAGRPKGSRNSAYALSEMERNELVKAAKKNKEETGKCVGDYIMEVLNDGNCREKMVAAKLYYEVVTAGSGSEQRVVEHNGVQIYLPEEDQ
jgi:hypothetical protein